MKKENNQKKKKKKKIKGKIKGVCELTSLILLLEIWLIDWRITVRLPANSSKK